MQENIFTVVNCSLRLSINHKSPMAFTQARIIYFLGKIFQNNTNSIQFDLKSYFENCLKELVSCFGKIDKIIRDEKTRIKLKNFLCLIQHEFDVSNIEIPLKDGHQYDTSHSWERCSQGTTEDSVTYLFGKEELQGYNYGQQIEQKIKQQSSELNERTRISLLLKFALPVLSRRLALNAFKPENFFSVVQQVELLISHLKDDLLEETERKIIFRFYEACSIYQQKNLTTMFKKEDDFFDALKNLNLQYSFGSALKIQHLSLLLERLYKDFPKLKLEAEIQQLIILIVQETQTVEKKQVKDDIQKLLPEEWRNKKELLAESRKGFEIRKSSDSIFKAQEKSTVEIQKLLSLFLKNSITLLGEPPCKLALLLLGSSSRYDRGPYSDLEVSLIYEPYENEKEKKHEVSHYIATFIALLEIQIVYLGESHSEKQGFWLDGTTSLRCHAHLRSDVEGMIKKGLREKERDTQMPVGKEQNPRNIKLHSFLYDPSAYSLMQPILVNSEHGGKELFESYQKALNIYLNEKPEKKFAEALLNLLYPKTEKIEKIEKTENPINLNKRQMTALWVWWDILRCLPDHVDLSTGEIDLKKAFHKPVAYLLMGLRLYYDLPAKNLEEILKQAVDKKILSPYLAQFLIQTLEWSIELRVNLHIKTGKQTETILLSALSPMLQKRAENLKLIFSFMEKAMRYFLKNNENPLDSGFQLDNIIGYYLQNGIKECVLEKDYNTWFLEVTSYLLYTRGLLETHRYHYRQIPDEHRQSCLTAAKANFDGCKDTDYGRTDDVFWVKLWNAPLSNGERPSHKIQKKNWESKLNSLLSPNEIVAKSAGLRVYIHGIKAGEFGLNPAIAKELLEKKWIDAKGKFVLKKDHPVASRMPGNHLVIPWPFPSDGEIEAILNQKQKNQTDEKINAELMTVIQQKAQFYIKVYPEYPLVELFLNELGYRLGHYPPREVDVWFWKSEKFDYPVMISEAVSGQTFQEVIEKDNPVQFNPQAFSESVIISGLASLEDNKPDNLILLQEPEGQRLCLIDADRWFVPAFKFNQLHAKNVVFCLPQMTTEIDPIFRQEILSLSPQLLLQAWVSEMESIGERCSSIFEGKIKLYFERADVSLTRDEARRTLLLPPLPFHAVNKLFNHLQNIKDFLASHSKITHSQLLSKIDSRLSNHYSLAREKHKQPLFCFKYAVGNAYTRGKGKDAQQEYFTSRMDFRTQMQDMWGAEEEQKRAKISIEQNWIQDIQIAKGQLTAFNEKEEIIDKAREEFLKGNFGRFLLLGPNGKDEILETLDWSILSLIKQRELLNHLMNNWCWLNLKIKNSKEIKDEDIQILIRKSPTLKKLHLSGCENLTYGIFEGLPEYDCTIKIIILEDLKNLKYMGYAGRLVYGEKCLELPNLEKLIITRCPILEEINIDAVQLKEVNLDNISSLKILRTQSQRLKNLSLTGSTTLPPLRECQKIMNSDYTENLCIFTWSTQNIKMKPFEKLFIKFPILLFVNWGDYETTLIEKLVNRLSENMEGKRVDYSKISLTLRKKLLDEIKKMLTYFISVLPKIIRALIKIVKDKDIHRSDRSNAALSLGNLKQATPEVIGALINGLEYEYSATYALAQLSQESPKVISELIHALRYKNRDGREYAAIALGRSNQATPEVIDALVKALEDKQAKHNGVRGKAAIALGNLKQATPGVVSSLLKVLGDGSQCISVKKNSAYSLGNLGQAMPEVIRALLKALEDKDGSVRQTAAAALVKLDRELPKAISALLNFLKDKDPVVRKEGAYALGNLKQATPEVIRALIKALEDKDDSVRQNAVYALGNLRQPTPQVLDTLIKALLDLSNGLVEIQAVSALAQLGQESPEVIGALLKAFLNRDHFTRRAQEHAASALVQLSKESPGVVGALIKKAVENKDRDIRTHARTHAWYLLVQLQLGQESPEDIGVLIKELEDTYWQYREDALSVLRHLKQATPQTTRAIIKALEDKDSRVREQAASVLGNFNPAVPEVIRALIKVLEDKDVSVRNQAAAALGNLKQVTPEVIGALIKDLGDADSNVRKQVVIVLGNLKQVIPEVIGMLLKALEDKNGIVRLTAASALGNFTDSLNAQIDLLFEPFILKKEDLIFPIVINEDKRNWGRLSNREVSKYAFSFFDKCTLKAAGTASKNSYMISKEIEMEHMKSNVQRDNSNTQSPDTIANENYSAADLEKLNAIWNRQ